MMSVMVSVMTGDDTQPENEAIQGVTFDLDGVYFVKGKARFVEALGREYGVPAVEARRVFFSSCEMNVLYKCGKITDAQFWNWAAQQWGLKVPYRELVSLLIASYRRDHSVQEFIQTLRSLGYSALVCSNNFSARIEGLQERFGFLDDFDTVVLSYEVGVTKPNPEIFRELVQRAGLAPGAIVYTDDNAAHTAAAASLGIRSVPYGGFSGFVEELRRLGVRV